jgi:hypothetical protein
MLQSIRTADKSSDCQVRVSAFSLSVVCLLSVLICVRRFPTRLRLGFLWAEDAPVFLKAAYERGIHSLFDGYAGYLHFDARLITYLVARASSLRGMPYILPWVCVSVYCLITMYLFTVALKILGSSCQAKSAAGVMALAPLLVPQTGEVYLSITNLQWILAPAMLACMWELISPAGTMLSPLQAVCRGVFMLTSALTGPFGIVFAAVGGMWFLSTIRRPRHLALIAAIVAFGTGAAVQLITILTLPQNETGHPHGVFVGFHWFSEFMRYFVTEAFYPGDLSTLQWHGNFLPTCALLLVVIAAALNPRWRIALVMLVLAICLWTLGVFRAGTPDIPVTWTGYGSRYVFIPHILIVWAMAIAFAASPRLWVKGIALATIALLLLVSSQRFETVLWDSQAWSVEQIKPGVFSVMVAPAPWNATITDLMHHGI